MRLGTEQLLLSDAVDMAVAQIDFRPLSGRKVFFDPSYVDSVKGAGFVNAPYIVSSLRQHLTAAGCMLQDKAEEAEIVVEARVGALGTNAHDVTYGLPQTTGLSSAAEAISNVPALPVLPELSLGRLDAQSGIAKVVVFAYDRQTRLPVWQSGIARSESTSRSAWVLGAGPIQRGTVHKGLRFAGSPLKGKNRDDESAVPYFVEHLFQPDPLVVPVERITEATVEADKSRRRP